MIKKQIKLIIVMELPKKTVKISQGNIDLDIPRDRNSSFDPAIIEKHNRDIRFPWDVLTVFWKFHYDNYLF